MINKSFIWLLLVLLQLSARAQQTYQLDIKKSKILWDNRKTMGGHHGYMLFNSGSLVFSPNADNATGTFMINMNNMKATDRAKPAENEAVNKKLRQDNYFDIDKYPVATMTVKQMVRVSYSNTYKVTGNLTIKSVTNPIEFKAKLTPRNGNIIYATAITTIDRLKWHIDMQPPNKPWDMFGAIQNKMIADQILITLNLVFVKAG